MAKIDLAAEIGKILAEYGDQIADDIIDATKEVTKKAAKVVKQEAQNNFNGTGAYAKGWSSQVETGRYSAQGVIYNKDLPGLPHLLEYGHAKRGGGRVAGKIHIQPIEQEVIKSFEDVIKRAV